MNQDEQKAARERASAVWQIARIIEDGLTPFINCCLAQIHGTPDYISKENERREELRKNGRSVRLLKRGANLSQWDYSEILNTIVGFWSEFKKIFDPLVPNPEEIKFDLKKMVFLRDKGVAHATLGSFTDEHLRELCKIAYGVLIAVGAADEAKRIRDLADKEAPGAFSREHLNQESSFLHDSNIQHESDKLFPIPPSVHEGTIKQSPAVEARREAPDLVAGGISNEQPAVPLTIEDLLPKIPANAYVREVPKFKQLPDEAKQAPKWYMPTFMPQGMLPGIWSEHLLRQPPNFEVVRKDKRMDELFARFVEAQRGEEGVELIAKYFNEPEAMTPGDHEQLGGYLKDFMGWYNMLEEARAGITDTDIDFMLRNEPELRFFNFSDTISEERKKEMYEALRAHIDKVFMQFDGSEMGRLVYSVRANQFLRNSEEYKKIADRIKTRVQNIETIDVEERSANFPNTLKLLERNWLSRAIAPQYAKQQQTNDVQLLQAMQGNRQNIMAVLGSTISSNDALVRRVSRAILYNEPIRVPQVGDNVGALSFEASEDRYVEDAIKLLNAPAVAAEIRKAEFKREVQSAAGKAWNAMSVGEREEASYSILRRKKLLPEAVLGGGTESLRRAIVYDMYFEGLRLTLRDEGVFKEQLLTV